MSNKKRHSSVWRVMYTIGNSHMIRIESFKSWREVKKRHGKSSQPATAIHKCIQRIIILWLWIDRRDISQKCCLCKLQIAPLVHIFYVVLPSSGGTNHANMCAYWIYVYVNPCRIIYALGHGILFGIRFFLQVSDYGSCVCAGAAMVGLYVHRICFNVFVLVFASLLLLFLTSFSSLWNPSNERSYSTDIKYARRRWANARVARKTVLMYQKKRSV